MVCTQAYTVLRQIPQGENKMIFRLKEQREAKGISKKKLSEMSGVSRPVIIRMESGTPVCVTTDTLDALALALRIEPVDLICPNCHQ